jgi:NADH dehydrogenase (ubiquinone) Fe-S protein 6
MKEPIIYVDGDTAICDGGGGALGHPVAYINVAHTGDEGEPCPYCSLRYAKRKKPQSHA